MGECSGGGSEVGTVGPDDALPDDVPSDCAPPGDAEGRADEACFEPNNIAARAGCICAKFEGSCAVDVKVVEGAAEVFGS